jgi:hypothetical protein
MMSELCREKATHWEGLGKHHINKYIFIDMIVIASISPFLKPRIARRSLLHIPGFREGR